MLSLFDIEDEVTKITNLPKNLIRDYCANPEAPLDSGIDQDTIELLAEINQNPKHPIWESLIVRHYSDIMQVDRGTLSPMGTYLRLARVDTITELLEFKAHTLPTLYQTTATSGIQQYDIPDKIRECGTWRRLPPQQKFEQVANYDSLENTFSPLADSTITDGPGNSVLALAAGAGHLGIVKCLLENKAKVNFFRWDGEAPLIHAARNGHYASVKFLIENSADVNLRTVDTKSAEKDTALMAAAKNKHADIIKLLLQNNADANQKDHSGHNVLSIASYKNDITSVRLLLEKGKITTENHQEAIYSASFFGHTEILALLLSNSTTVDIQDDTCGLTPLAWAVKGGHAETAIFLLERGANIHHRTKSNKTPFNLANSISGLDKKTALLKVLRSAQTIEELAHKYGDTPVKSLIRYGDAGVLLAVLYHGLKNKAGFAALVIGAGIGLTLGLSEDVRDEIDLPTWAISVISVAVSALILLIGNAIIRNSHGPALTFGYPGPTSNNTSTATSSSSPSGPDLK